MKLGFIPAGEPSPISSLADALEMAKALEPKLVVAVYCSMEEEPSFKEKFNGETRGQSNNARTIEDVKTLNRMHLRQANPNILC